MSDELEDDRRSMVKEKFTMAGMRRRSPLLRKEPKRTLEPSSVKPMRRVNASPAKPRRRRARGRLQDEDGEEQLDADAHADEAPVDRLSVGGEGSGDAEEGEDAEHAHELLLEQAGAGVLDGEDALVAASAAGAASP